MAEQRRRVLIGALTLLLALLAVVLRVIIPARLEQLRAAERESRSRLAALRLRALEDRVIFHPSHTAVVELARAYEAAGRPAEAATLRARAASRRPASEHLSEHVGARGPETSGLRSLLERSDREPNNQALQRQVVDLCQQSGRLSTAIPALERLARADPGDVATRRRLGIAELQAGRSLRACRHLRAAVTRAPRDPVAWFYLGLAHTERAEVQEALAAFDRVLSIRPDYTPAALERIRLQVEDWRLQEAVVEARRLIRRRPRLADAHYHLGVALFHRHDLPTSTAALREAVRLDPRRARYHGWLGLTLLQQGRVAEATSALESAVARNPTYANAHFQLARAYLQQGRRDEAERSLRQTLILDPRFSEAYVSLGQLLKRRGLIDQARLLLARFRALSKFEEQRQFLEHRALAEPHRPEWRRQLGDLYARENLLREAQIQHEIAHELAANPLTPAIKSPTPTPTRRRTRQPLKYDHE